MGIFAPDLIYAQTAAVFPTIELTESDCRVSQLALKRRFFHLGSR